jgi:hypothetical protein
MRDLEATDSTILTLKESIRLDDLALEDPECTTDRALAVRLHKAGCITQLRELWQHRLRLVSTRPEPGFP